MSWNVPYTDLSLILTREVPKWHLLNILVGHVTGHQGCQIGRFPASWAVLRCIFAGKNEFGRVDKNWAALGSDRRVFVAKTPTHQIKHLSVLSFFLRHNQPLLRSESSRQQTHTPWEPCRLSAAADTIASVTHREPPAVETPDIICRMCRVAPLSGVGTVSTAHCGGTSSENPTI